MNRSCTRILTLASILLLAAAAIAQESQAPKATAPGDSQSKTEQASEKPAATADASDSNSKNSGTYKIGAGDELAIAVWKEPELTQKVPVRPDGMITMPLVGDVKAAGLTPLELQASLEEKLKSYISSPAVTVIVNEVRSHVFNVLGQVQRPGTFPLVGRTTVLDALAQAGGFKDFANTKKIYVMRTKPDGTVERLPFNYKDVIKGKNPEQNVELKSHDTVIVP